jgi:hypothetical protein
MASAHPIYPVAITSASKARFKWGEIHGGVKFYALSEPQLDILASRAKYTWAFAGTGGGKTCLGPLWLWKHLESFRKREPTEFYRALVVSPTLPIFESSQLKQHIIGVFDNTAFHGEWNSQKKTYTGPNFEIVCRSADNDPSSLTGGQYDSILMDEAWSISNPEVWAEVRRRSNIKDAPILGVTTPNVNGWIHSDVYQAWESGDPEFYVRQWATDANPAKTPEQHAKFLDQERKKLGEARFNRMYGGLFTAVTGLIYDVFSDQRQPRYPVIPTPDVLPSPAVRCFVGLDWGWADPTVALMFVRCANGVVYCVDELYQSNLPLDELGVKLRKLIEKWTIRHGSRWGEVLKEGFFEAIYCDTSRPESAQLMRQYGLTVRRKKIADIEAGIAMTDQMFRTGRLKVFDCAKNLIREAGHYEYKSNGEPKGGNDHAMDALRYGVSSHMDGKPITIMDGVDDALTPSQDDANEAQKAIRLGHIETPAELEWKELQAQAKRQRDWEIKMENMDEEDCLAY